MYEGDLVHRLPGDASTLTPKEQQFPVCAEWVTAELQPQPQPTDASSQVVSESPKPSPSDSERNSFTRVIVADLKPEVLQQIFAPDRYETVCRDLAHLYHYYLHGHQGNRLTSQISEEANEKHTSKRRKSDDTGQPERMPKPSGQKLPDIVIEHIVEGQPKWYAHLADVDDDPESLYLRAQQAQLLFTLAVPDHGVVSGVLWYFPYQGDAETMPLLGHPMQLGTGQSNHATQLTQAGPGHATQMTQLPPGSQAPFGGTDCNGNKPSRMHNLLCVPASSFKNIEF